MTCPTLFDCDRTRVWGCTLPVGHKGRHRVKWRPMTEAESKRLKKAVQSPGRRRA